MLLDVVSNRELISRVRSIAGSIPFVWFFYRQYWRIRRWRESQKIYHSQEELVKFGEFPSPSLASPVSQLCTAEQMLSPIYDDWCDAIHSPPRFSRKQWEFVFIMQALEKAGMLSEGKSGLGFGCGREPLAGLFASTGCQVLATDLDPHAAHLQGWVDTMQHSASLEELYKSAKRILSKKDFFDRVRFESADMNQIPETFFGKFDFVWSACALEHLGSLQHGMDFIKNSLRCIKPGGVVVHTTEFNLSSNDETMESKNCSIYRARDIQKLIDEVEAGGFVVAPLNLNHGNKPVDRHVDLPPYGFSPHIKLKLEGYVVTSIGLIIHRPH
jgi:2-polyprenyl-3-methyl-5-hydroxy-6-metoxy-1,4-benzoquinol methylase